MKHQGIEAAAAIPAAEELLFGIPHRVSEIGPKRAFREPGEIGSNEAIFVLSGILSIFKRDPLGKRHIVALRFPNEAILPHAPGAGNVGIQPMTPSSIATVHDFDGVVGRRSDLGWIFWRLAQRNEAIAHEWLLSFGGRDALSRIAHLLCEMRARGGFEPLGAGEWLVNPFSQQQMAEITGQTSVNVNRVLMDLERQGLIERANREIRFLDWAELRRLAGFQPAYLGADLAGI